VQFALNRNSYQDKTKTKTRARKWQKPNFHIYNYKLYDKSVHGKPDIGLPAGFTKIQNDDLCSKHGGRRCRS
jgi:hypothetical protein